MTQPVHSDFLTYFSIVLGWTYFVAWSLSFYPQVWDNFRRKSVVGLSFDFLGFNIIGHSCYMIFNCVMFWSYSIQEKYHELNPGKDKGNPVLINDVVFSIHAVTLTLITIIQCLIYDRGTQRILSWTARIIITGIMISIIILVSLSLAHVLEWYFFLQSLGFIKIGMSTIKYVPQAWMNFHRKSTVGWSIGNILMDFSGGCLSILQMVIDAINSGDWSPFYSNIPKFALGQLSMVFAVIFMVQHYCLYPHWKQKKDSPETFPTPETTDDLENPVKEKSNEEKHSLLEQQ